MNLINIQNGTFKLTDEIEISRNRKFQDVLNLSCKSEILDHKNGYKWIYLSEIIVDNHIFNVNICFHNENLYCIDFNFRSRFDNYPTWDTYNLEEKKTRKKIYDKWLTDLIGKQRNFNWGVIGTYFDLKSGSSGIIIRYQ